MAQIKEIREEALDLLKKAESARDKVSILKEIREQIKLMADIMLKSIRAERTEKAG